MKSDVKVYEKSETLTFTSRETAVHTPIHSFYLLSAHTNLGKQNYALVTSTPCTKYWHMELHVVILVEHTPLCYIIKYTIYVCSYSQTELSIMFLIKSAHLATGFDQTTSSSSSGHIYIYTKINL